MTGHLQELALYLSMTVALSNKISSNVLSLLLVFALLQLLILVGHFCFCLIKALSAHSDHYRAMKFRIGGGG